MIRGVENDENLMVAAMSMISDNILIEGGAPRFLAERINHQTVIAGKRFIIPFSRRRFRL